MKRFIVYFFLGIFCSFVLQSVFVEAKNMEPCSVETISDLFSESIIKHRETFFTKDVMNSSSIKKQVEDNLLKYIESETQFYAEISSILVLENYHTKQSQLFEHAIKQSLQNYQDIARSLKDKTKYKHNFEQLTWSPTIKDSITHPILSLYANKFQENAKIKDQLPMVPTLVLGLEATLNYTIFSCNYTRDTNQIFDTQSPMDVFQKETFDTQERASKLLEAKRILDLTLNSYDALAVAYPQHVAYLELIKELKILRDQFGTMEELSSECVVRNHLYDSCQK